MRLKTVIILVGALVIANLLAGIFSNWVSNIFLIPYQNEYIAQNIIPVASRYYRRFANSQESAWNSIVQEIQAEQFIEVQINKAITHPYFQLSEGATKPFEVYASNTGFLIVILPRKNSEVVIGPLPGTAWVAALPDYFPILPQVAMTCLVLAMFVLPLRHRSQRLLEQTSASLGGDRRINPNSLAEQFFAEFEQLRNRVEECDQQTRRRLDDQRDFLHGVAHEFRGPLARLRFVAHMEEIRDEQTIDEIVDEMDLLVSEILEYSRYHHGLFQPNYVSLALQDLIVGLISRIQPNINRVTIEVDPAISEFPPVMADEALVSRCLTNLLQNALRFARSAIEVNGYVTAAEFVLTVNDDGPGIATAKKTLIFEPFVRLDPSRSRDSGGFGLGLAIVKGITDRLGGEVTADESPLGGARFVLRIPRNPASLPLPPSETRDNRHSDINRPEQRQ